MPYLLEFLLFLSPFLVFWLWRRFQPEHAPDSPLVLAALLGVGLMLAAGVWFGLSVSMPRHPDYVPAQMGTDGHVVPGGARPVR